MQKTDLKTKKLSAINIFAQKASKIFAINNGTVFFINRMKLEKVLSLLCLLAEFNENFMYVEFGNVTKWLKKKRLLTPEFLYEISEIVTKKL